jgi:hypothetical protein
LPSPPAGSIPRDEADLDRTVLRRAEAYDPAKVELFLQTEEVDVEVVTGARVANVEVRDDPMDHLVADPALAVDVVRPMTGISRRAMPSLLRIMSVSREAFYRHTASSPA